MMITQYISIFRKKYLLFLLTFLQLNIYSQYDEQQVLDKKEIKALEKEKRIAEKKENEEEAKKLVEYMLDNKKFVLEANYLSGRSGSRIPVNSMLNFISIDSNKGVIQLANTWGVGYNGVGGITVEGTITKYEVSKKVSKRGGISYTVMLYFMSNIGMYDLSLWVSQSGNADASISGISPGQLNYSGQLVPIQTSRTYKAHAFP
jgi:hypothetical protein